MHQNARNEFSKRNDRIDGMNSCNEYDLMMFSSILYVSLACFSWYLLMFSVN